MPEDSTVAHVIKHLQLDDQVPKVILVHGRPAQMDAKLSDKDIIAVFPVTEGG
ncbi:MAG: MoaD/ThiS family protein [Thermodesulfobacteriota bacterium]